MADVSSTVLPWPQTWRVDDQLNRASRYSYACGACGQCCQDKLIQVNPYEVALLAQNLGLSTTECIAQHLDGIYLRRQPDGRCTFVGERGCSVHAARPLVCRLYPLGRALDAAGAETFRHLMPHPHTSGVYGESATVQDWITAQGAQPLMDAVDVYLALFYRLFSLMEAQEGSDRGVRDWPQQTQATTLPDLLDMDRALASEAVSSGDLTLAQRMDRHIAILKERFGLTDEPISADDH